MGTSHLDSNLEGKDGTETITNIASVESTKVKATSYVQIGDHKYIFTSEYSTEASIVANATSVDASVKGSITLGNGRLWVHDTDTAATLLS